MLKNLLPAVALLLVLQMRAQTFWRDVAGTDFPETAARKTLPSSYRLIRIDPALLEARLPAPGGPFSNRTGAEVSLDLPMPGGGSAVFYLRESAVMAPALQARYPEIRTFSGHSADDPTALLKCDWTPRGFHAMLLSARWGTVFIDPYRPGDPEYYLVYYKKDYQPADSDRRFSCGVAVADINDALTPVPTPAGVTSRSSDGLLRQYRLALACTGEYAQFHGGDKSSVLAAMVSSVNRVNGVYEREFAVSLQLIANNDTLIFLDADTDPYQNNNGGAMLGQNRMVCNNLIGMENYDIGHVFSTGGGGIASLRSVCTNNKAEGVTGQASPIGDPFDIDYVAHEIGHQFGGNHTQNNNCSRSGPTAMEPGSGSTIMGYAGICPPNVQPNSHDYFHGVNVAEMLNFITFGEGNSCPTLTPNGNAAPVVNAGENYIIPKSTPFALRAQATDPDSADALTYCWEQMDNESAFMPPNASNMVGPMFRSLPPSISPTRYFPQLTTLTANDNTAWEKLPTVGRKLNFRVTVRDNNPAGGRTASDDMLITVADNAGPFLVREPNAAETWRGGEYKVIAWDVANTDRSPVFCAAVNIRLSVDGGFTYPYLLAAGVPNNGVYCVQVPDIATTRGRIMVEAADNVFFDISDADLTLEPASAPAFSLCIADPRAQVCLPGLFTTDVTTTALSGFSKPLTLSVEGLPPGTEATFNPNPVMPGETAQMTLSFPAGLPEGLLDVYVTGAGDGDTARVETYLTIVSNYFDALRLLAPINGAVGLDQSPVLYWQSVADADAYDLELAYNPSFEPANLRLTRNNISVDSLRVPVILEKGKVFYWRVRPVNECGPGAWVGPFAFATVVNACSNFVSEDVPKNITASQAVTVESRINVLSSGTVSDINLTKIQGNHAFFRDLEATLVGPDGTSVSLFAEKCGGYNGSFLFGFDDSAVAGLSCPPPTTGAIFSPAQPLSVFHGKNTAGGWILRVKDNVVSSGGAITAFELEICSNTALSPPVLVNNQLLQVEPGKNKAIGSDLLKAEDADNSAPELVYTLLTVPLYGELQIDWPSIALQPGAQFTQAEIDAGFLRYFDYGLIAGPDYFLFSVTDGEGGLALDTFHIQALPVSVQAPAARLTFTLSPNPARETVRLTFPQGLPSDTRIRMFDLTGRLLASHGVSAGQEYIVLNIAHLPEGIYVLAVENAAGSGVGKLEIGN